MDNKTGVIHSIKYLTLSQRIARIMASTILMSIVATEALLATPWLLVLSALSVYSIVTGISGWDPILNKLKQSHPQLPDQMLSLATQLECATFGLACIAVGVFYRGSDSILLNLLPLLGIYPILICAIKHDLLALLVQSYRRGIAAREMNQD